MQSKSKPAWALTEKAKEQLEVEEADECLTLPKIWTSKSTWDLEVRAAIEAVQDRISKLDESKEAEREAAPSPDLGADEGKVADYESKYDEGDLDRQKEEEKKKKKKRASARLTKENIDRAGLDRGASSANKPRRRIDDDLQSIHSAQSVLSDVKSLRGIHSARSLQALARTAAKEMGKDLAKLPPVLEEAGEFVPP